MFRHVSAAAVGLVLLVSVGGAQAPQVADSAPAGRAEKLKERDRLWAEARRLRSSGNLAEAQAAGRKMLAIEREAFTENNEELAISINWLAEVAEQAEDWPAAKAARREGLEWNIRYRGAEHWKSIDARLALEYATQRESLTAPQRTELSRAAELDRQYAELNNAGRYAEAIPLLRRQTEIYRSILGRKHPVFAASLNNLAVLHFRTGDYARAESGYVEVLAIRKEVLGDKHPRYAISLNNLGVLYKHLRDYARAEPLQLEVLKIDRDVYGARHPEYATDLNNLAMLYESMGDYARAEPLHVEALEIKKQVLGSKHPDFAMTLNNLAALYYRSGDYARAEPLYVEALAIRKEVLGQKHPNYAISLNNLAVLYKSMADYARAEPLYLEAMRIDRDVFGARHPTYATDLNNLGLFYESLGDYARAESLYVEALTIQKQVLGSKHPDYAMSVNNLAALYYVTGDYARAEPLYVEALAIRKEVLGATHPDYAMSLNNLAFLYKSLGDYTRAEPLFVQALDIERETFGEKHPGYATYLNNLALFFVDMGREAEAEPLFRKALAISRASLEGTAVVQSERQQLAMGQRLRHQLDGYVSLGLNSKRSAREIFSEVLLWKGSTLVRQRGMRMAAGDPAVADLFKPLQRTTSQLAALSRAIPTDKEQQKSWSAQLAALTQVKERLESQLSSKSAAFRTATKDLTLDDLVASLPPDAVLVDYLEFHRNISEKGKPATHERQLVAFVVRHAEKPEDQVVMVSLGPVAPIGTAIDRWRATFGVGEDATAAGAELRKRVWEPVEKAMMNEEPSTKNSAPSLLTPGPSPARGDGSRTILVSTDGVLGRMPLGALPGREPGTYLIDDHRLAMIPVPQLLPALTAAEDRPPTHELLLLGDVDYDAVFGAKSPLRPTDTQLTTVHRNSGLRAPTTGSEHFSRLPGTKSEVEAIERLFRAAKPDSRLVMLGTAEATEARFRELAPQCRILHLATHGFFAPQQFKSATASDAANPSQASQGAEDAAVVGYSPNLLSGLVMAGANHPPRDDGDDGILTAEEIACLPLDGARLVTLSACETGLGETAGGEGLLGLQRAFQVSGARSTIASYWKVDDQVTRELMERFYRNIHARSDDRSTTMLDALRDAQLWILRHPQDVAAALRSRGADVPEDEPGLMTNPRYWAAFTLSGDWR